MALNKNMKVRKSQNSFIFPIGFTDLSLKVCLAAYHGHMGTLTECCDTSAHNLHSFYLGMNLQQPSVHSIK